MEYNHKSVQIEVVKEIVRPFQSQNVIMNPFSPHLYQKMSKSAFKKMESLAMYINPPKKLLNNNITSLNQTKPDHQASIQPKSNNKPKRISPKTIHFHKQKKNYVNDRFRQSHQYKMRTLPSNFTNSHWHIIFEFLSTKDVLKLRQLNKNHRRISNNYFQTKLQLQIEILANLQRKNHNFLSTIDNEALAFLGKAKELKLRYQTACKTIENKELLFFMTSKQLPDAMMKGLFLSMQVLALKSEFKSLIQSLRGQYFNMPHDVKSTNAFCRILIYSGFMYKISDFKAEDEVDDERIEDYERVLKGFMENEDMAEFYERIKGQHIGTWQLVNAAAYVVDYLKYLEMLKADVKESLEFEEKEVSLVEKVDRMSKAFVKLSA